MPNFLLLLRDGRLLLSFERYQNIFVYSPNGNSGWNEYPEVIINNEENYFLIIELYNNVLLLIGKYLRVSLGCLSKKSFHIAFFQNDENDCCLYALQLKNKRILLLFILILSFQKFSRKVQKVDFIIFMRFGDIHIITLLTN